MDRLVVNLQNIFAMIVILIVALWALKKCSTVLSSCGHTRIQKSLDC